MRHFLVFLCAVLLCTSVQADELDPATRNALQQTQQLLKDRGSLERLMSKDPQARKADQLATELTGTGAHREELYSIASRIFEGVITRSGGDPAALQKLIEEAKQDPARFMATLPPEEQRQIRELAKKIESSTAAGRSGVPMKRP